MAHRFALALLTLVCTVALHGQGGVRGSIPNITQKQAAALVRMYAALQPLAQSVVDARTSLVAATLTLPADEAALQAKADAVRTAELALAKARAEGFVRIQGSPDKFAP